MEKSDIELVEKHRATNYELDRLYREHIKFEGKIEDLEARKGLSANESKELVELKKLKLTGRDKIEDILKTLR